MTAAIVVILALAGAAPADARKKKGKGRAQPNSQQCLQQAGASLDPATRQWTFYVTERDGMSRMDMLRLCLAGGDRSKARTITIPERATNPGG